MKTVCKRITACRLCASADLVDLFSLGSQYVSDFVADTEVLAGPLVPIEIVLCRGCSLVQQRYSTDQSFLYQNNYWYRSGTTSTMKDHLQQAATEIILEARLEPGDLVIDIGANDGTLISSFSRLLRRIGVEPAPNFQTPSVHAEGREGVVWLRKFWPLDKDDMDNERIYPKAKAITAFGMFYDLEDPQAFINGVAEALHPDGIFVAQLMCLRQTIKQADVGNFCHEHLEFYSLKSLELMFERAGLAIYNIEQNHINGGSYRLWVSKKGTMPIEGTVHIARNAEERKHLDDPATYHILFEKMRKERNRCLMFIDEAVSKGKQVWVYGASTKGNVILQWYGLDSGHIVSACDASTHKKGLYTPGSGIRITDHTEFRAAKPDYALVLPYAFIDEFRQFEKDWLQSGGKFLVPLPTFREVGA